MEVYSKSIENFLDFLRRIQEENSIALQEQKDHDQATQDLLHRLELGDDSYHDIARLGIALKDVRQKRREAKDIESVLNPIVSWCYTNDKTIKSLEKLLGDVRKEEKNLRNRCYIDRTDAVKEALDKPEKQKKNTEKEQSTDDKVTVDNEVIKAEQQETSSNKNTNDEANELSRLFSENDKCDESLPAEAVVEGAKDGKQSKTRKRKS